jgi:hypothetical protein
MAAAPENPLVGTIVTTDDLAPGPGDWVLVGRTAERYRTGPVDGVVIQVARWYR